jgi:hypothetical protein
MKKSDWMVIGIFLFGVACLFLGVVIGQDACSYRAGAMGRAVVVVEPVAWANTAAIERKQPVPTTGLPAGLEVTKAETVTYTYRLDERGQRAWSEAGKIAAGQLVKVQGCADGYRQVEYQPDQERPWYWRVEWLRCE